MNRKLKIVVGLAILMGLWAALPKLFLPQSIDSMLAWLPMVALVSIGQMLVVTTGGIDVSVGSNLGLSAMVLGIAVSRNSSTPLGSMVLICLIIGAGLGMINWGLIWGAKIQPLVATIATLATFRGFAFLVGGGSTITGSMLPEQLVNLSGTGILIGKVTVSWLVLISVFITLSVSLGLRYLPIGRAIYAYGGQPIGAFRRGLSERNVLFVSYVACGALAGLAGGFYASRFGLVHPGTAGYGLELTAIAAVVIGGTKLSGGVGSAWGVFASCIFLSVLNVALSVAGIGADWQLFVYGAVLLLALATDRKSSLAVRAGA